MLDNNMYDIYNELTKQDDILQAEYILFIIKSYYYLKEPEVFMINKS